MFTQHDITTSQSISACGVTFLDINEDGVPDGHFLTRDNRLVLADGKTDTVLWVGDSMQQYASYYCQASIEFLEPDNAATGRIVVSTGSKVLLLRRVEGENRYEEISHIDQTGVLLVADVTGDARKEFIMLGEEYRDDLLEYRNVFVFDEDLRLLKSHYLPGLKELVQNGIDIKSRNLVAIFEDYVQVIDIMQGKVIWESSQFFDEIAEGGVGFSDLDNNGVSEMFIGTFNSVYISR